MITLRKCLLLLATTSLACFTNAETVTSRNTVKLDKQTSTQEKLAKLESSFDRHIGVYAIDTGNNEIVKYRANELFPVQSTFKLMGVATLLKQSTNNKTLLQEKIHYTKNDLIFWHPITGKYLTSGMTLEALAGAAISYSDNPAINLIMKKLGGPEVVTEFAHSIGNKSFNVSKF